MTALLVVLVVVAGLALGALAVTIRQRRRLSQHLDRIANRSSGTVAPASRSPEFAVRRLEEVLTQHSAQQQSMETVRRYEAALEALEIGVVVVDERSAVVYCNAAASWYREGRHGEAVIAQKIDDLIVAAVAGEQVSETVVLYGPPRRVLFVSALPLVTAGEADDADDADEADDADDADSADDADEVVGAVALIHDVSELEHSNAIRRDFVTNISHELRTPIGAVSLLAETLIDETDPEVINSLGKRLFVEAQRLSSAVSDLLELSRIEHSGRTEFAPVAIQKVIAEAHDRVRAAASQSGVEINIELPALELCVQGDRRQLTSAVFNLLDNGIKFSNPSGSTVLVTVREIYGQVTVEVADNGIGIPRQDLDRVFERFYRVDRGRSRTSGGTGLGLAMVRHIVANHGGHIVIESTEGEGTTFRIDLPVAPRATESAPEGKGLAPPEESTAS